MSDPKLKRLAEKLTDFLVSLDSSEDVIPFGSVSGPTESETGVRMTLTSHEPFPRGTIWEIIISPVKEEDSDV